jgi:2-amino-4-hydroxy-6-hydroxymethyldihydropteridine diphosphokinase
MTHTLYLALGSNIGDRAANLEAAIAALNPEVRTVERSPIYITPPWGYTDQADFLNMVIRADTDLAPDELLRFLKVLEKELGRTPNFKNGPRVIDLDIIFYDDLNLAAPNLNIPHPHMAERAFVLVPLAAMAPELRHPVTGRTMRELAEAIDQSGIYPYQPEGSG